MQTRRVVVGLLLAALLSWGVAATRMRGMNEGPGTDLGTLAAFLGIWVTYSVFLVARGWGSSFLDWDGNGPFVAGAAVAAAGAYQLTPAKDACLRHCRSPLHFLTHSWREGRAGALRLGVVHGAYCVGCCVGLFVILFAVGS